MIDITIKHELSTRLLALGHDWIQCIVNRSTVCCISRCYHEFVEVMRTLNRKTIIGQTLPLARSFSIYEALLKTMSISRYIETSWLFHRVSLIEVHYCWVKLWMLLDHLSWCKSSFIVFLKRLKSGTSHSSSMPHTHGTVTGDSLRDSSRYILTAFCWFLFSDVIAKKPNSLWFSHLSLLKLFDVPSYPLRSTHSCLLINFLGG